MELHFNVKGDKRKAMVKAIEKETGVKAKYLGVPSCAYQVGKYKVLKDGVLVVPDAADVNESSNVIDACVMATGESPSEWDENTVEKETESHQERVCPKCRALYKGHPALSRVDNETLICPLCGTREALESMGIPENEQELIIERIIESQEVE